MYLQNRLSIIHDPSPSVLYSESKSKTNPNTPKMLQISKCCRMSQNFSPSREATEGVCINQKIFSNANLLGLGLYDFMSTTEIWTANNRSYMGITPHGISAEIESIHSSTSQSCCYRCVIFLVFILIFTFFFYKVFRIFLFCCWHKTISTLWDETFCSISPILLPQ